MLGLAASREASIPSLWSESLEWSFGIMGGLFWAQSLRQSATILKGCPVLFELDTEYLPGGELWRTGFPFS